MAEQNYDQSGSTEVTDRGMFDFLKKKKEDEHTTLGEELNISTEFEEKVKVSKDEDEKKEEGGLLSKLHRSDSSSSSSSDEEDEEKKKRKEKKKGVTEKIKEKLHGSDDKDDTHVPIEETHEQEFVYVAPTHPTPALPPVEAAPEEKKGLLEKIKDKMPGQTKKDDVDSHVAVNADVDGQEKKGFLEKIKEKIPGFHAKPEEEKREIEPPTSST